jgi:hypothetical protein
MYACLKDINRKNKFCKKLKLKENWLLWVPITIINTIMIIVYKISCLIHFQISKRRFGIAVKAMLYLVLCYVDP